MKYLMVIGLILLSGCSGSIDQNELKDTNDYCADKGGVFTITVSSIGLAYHIMCKNGTTVNMWAIQEQQ